MQKENIGKMNTKTISINDAIEHLKYFSEDVIEFFSHIDIYHIISVEDKLEMKLPQDYIDFLLITNGVLLMGEEILGISISEGNYGLIETYYFEHFEVENPMPKELIPFSPDGFGNHYCFDIINENIVLWEHDCDYNTYQPKVVCNTLGQFIQNEIIDNILKEYDFKGNKK